MKKLLLCTVFLCSCSYLIAQVSVHFIVYMPSLANDTVYISGDFNQWNPGDKHYKLTPIDDNHQGITISVPAGHHEFKFTRGIWFTVESNEAGLDITNRTIEVKNDTTVKLTIEGWIDRFKDISGLPDTTQWRVAYLRSYFYLEKNVDSSYKYARLANSLVEKTNNKFYEAEMARILGRVMLRQGNYQRALEYFLKQLQIAESLHDSSSVAFCLLDLGNLFSGLKDYTKAKSYYHRVTKFYKVFVLGHDAANSAMVRLGRLYYDTHQLDSAKFYAQQAYNTSIHVIDRTSQSEALTLLGDILATEGKPENAIPLYHQAVEQGLLYNSFTLIAENYQHMAKAFYNNHQSDSAYYYARQAYEISKEVKNPFIIADASNLLVTLFKGTRQTDSAFKYLEMVVAAKDSLFSQDKVRQVQTIVFDEQLHQQEIKDREEKFQTHIKLYALLAGLAGFILIASILFRSNRNKQRANQLLSRQKEEIQATLKELKAAQAQLVQSEKMASLGELTAGVAHEIQNPLNFVKNFSEVNKELIEEVKSEIERGNTEEAKQLADEIMENEQKITLHSKRADAIVKGMLQHSRKHAGQKLPTDINALADEFMRLSYHGLRAKDKSFNAYLETHFDENVGKPEIIPQDIGRVLLNLFNNAFYAVNEKNLQLKSGDYKPVVSVTTKKLQDAIEITIRDNGLGISQEIIDKIFQPFFTTKPMGEGTGLGLSLSYDIIKVHEGTLKVNTAEGEYAEFIIQLPLKSSASSTI